MAVTFCALIPNEFSFKMASRRQIRRQSKKAPRLRRSENPRKVENDEPSHEFMFRGIEVSRVDKIILNKLGPSENQWRINVLYSEKCVGCNFPTIADFVEHIRNFPQLYDVESLMVSSTLSFKEYLDVKLSLAKEIIGFHDASDLVIYYLYPKKSTVLFKPRFEIDLNDFKELELTRHECFIKPRHGMIYNDFVENFFLNRFLNRLS